VTVDTAAIESRAEAVLDGLPSYVWDGHSLPVPVERIADSWFGLLVRDVADLSSAPGAPELASGQTFSGLLLPDRGEIWVNAGEAIQWPGRRRFTIGHEIGHHVMHRRDTHSLFCRSAVVEEDDTEERARLPLPEDEANTFAAALLMPRWLVCRDYRRGMDFDALCGRYGASMAAMSRRLRGAVPPRESKRWAEIEREIRRRLIERWARHLDAIDADARRRRVSERRVLVLVVRDRLRELLADAEGAPRAMVERGCHAEVLWAAADFAVRRGARDADEYARAVCDVLGLEDVAAGEGRFLDAAAKRAERGLRRRG
jgi:Zn-dependent peptidase ImmA (M78 family)